MKEMENFLKDYIYRTVLDIIADCTGTEKDKITENSNFYNDFGLNKIDVIFLITDIATESGVLLPQEEKEKIVTVKDMVDVLFEKLIAD